MNKNLASKAVLIIVLVLVAVWVLYPPSQKLKSGLDLAGGTSLIYSIDTEGLNAQEQKGLAQRMIENLRRRIDPANIQNLIWRPQGNTRFEIQMPLASKASREKRKAYETALNELLAKNVNAATIMRALQEPPAERAKSIKNFAKDDPNRVEILNELVTTFDERNALQGQRDTLNQTLTEDEKKVKATGVDMDLVEANRNDWIKLGDEALKKKVTEFVDPNDPNNAVAPLTAYLETYKQRVDVLNKLTDPNGVNDRYDEAKRKLDKLNLSQDQITFAVQLPEGSSKRQKRIDQLKSEFADRADLIDRVVAAYDTYRPVRGQLDDPRDLQRMLKGAGILEWRVLPTKSGTALSSTEIQRYTDALKEKGPKTASDNSYKWCEIEKIDEWHCPGSIVASFGDKWYVLASNKPDETILRTQKWKLEKSQPATDRMGRRAIGFRLDDRGGRLFYNVTLRNGGRPLCILLDDVAISAPGIEEGRPVGSEGIITGSFSQTAVTDMVNKLNAGSLPARLIEQPISEKTIGPSIGANNRKAGIEAGIIGLFVVMAIMLGYYILAGAIADVALLLNILFVLAIMAGLSATFTLPGIAGIILTIGMSVDANVLIFERIREEQAKGLGLVAALRNGYQRAFRTIFDANLTTFLTALILYYVASEEVKGFAIVLMLGIASSMFTALFVTRVIFDFLISKKVITKPLFMLRLIREPKVNWMAMRKIFFTISGTLIILGLIVFFTRDDTKNNKYDIEFTGGTSVQIDLQDNVNLTRQDVQDRISEQGAELGNPALEAANVYAVGDTGHQFEITTTATNKTRGTVTFEAGKAPSIDQITAAIKKAQSESNRLLSSLTVTPDNQQAETFVVSSSRVNPSVMQNILEKAFPNASVAEPHIDEVVSDAVRSAFEGQLKIQQNLEPNIVSEKRITEDTVDTYPELADYIAGLMIQCHVKRPASLEEIQDRMKRLRFKPDTQNLGWYNYDIFAPGMKPVEPNQPLNDFVFVSVAPEAGLRELSEDEWNRFVENERKRILAATTLETSLPQVTQIDPSIGSESKTRALIAIFLSLSAIIGYVWLRFGNVRYGLTAIAALVHDVTITLGAVTACTYLAGTALGNLLLIGDFKIDLAMIAAFLTLIGYSLNDTIVVFDRIRENRHKAQLTDKTISDSINQTVSRTIMTSFTTFVVILVMYIFGGEALRGFTFAIGFGVVIGTYSSIAIAAPLLLVGLRNTQPGKPVKQNRKSKK